MKTRTNIYIPCPKCLKRLELKEANFNSTPYCKHCDIEYNVNINAKEMKIEITESEQRLFANDTNVGNKI